MTDTKCGQINEAVDGSLRIRIAHVLYESGQRPMATAARLADAVIRELGLRKVTDVNRSVPQHRYVTEWTAE